jgi:hypothetical protein
MLPLGRHLRIGLYTDPTSLCLEIDRPILWHPTPRTDLTADQIHAIEQAIPCDDRQFLGFQLIHGDVVTENPVNITTADHVFTVGLPVPLVFSLLFASPLLLWTRHRRQQIRRRNGLCPACGYDLRASKDRCPECGAPIITNTSLTP